MHAIQLLMGLILSLQIIQAGEVKFFKDCNFTREGNITQEAKPLYNTIICNGESNLRERYKYEYGYRVTYNKNKIEKVQYTNMGNHGKNVKVFFILYYNNVGMLTREVDIKNKFSVDYCLGCGYKLIDYEKNGRKFRKEVFYDSNNIETNSITTDSNNSIIEVIQYNADNNKTYIYSNQGIKALGANGACKYEHPQCDISIKHTKNEPHLYYGEINRLCPPLEYSQNDSSLNAKQWKQYLDLCPEVQLFACSEDDFRFPEEANKSSNSNPLKAQKH